jgi:hypothetical protein
VTRGGRHPHGELVQLVWAQLLQALLGHGSSAVPQHLPGGGEHLGGEAASHQRSGRGGRARHGERGRGREVGGCEEREREKREGEGERERERKEREREKRVTESGTECEAEMQLWGVRL